MSLRITRPIALLGVATIGLTACDKPFDIDLRSLANGFDTSEAVTGIAERPAADANGVISYPTYQVAMARRGETVADVAGRLGLNAADLARTNGLTPTATLREGELLTLPAGASVSSTAPTTDLPAGTEPKKHAVKTGETAFSIARLYDVPVQALAQMNNLDDNLSVRPGQQLLIPVVGGTIATTPLQTTAPGQGSPTPTPPSSTTALPATSPERVVTPAATATAATAATATTTAVAAAPKPAPAPQPAPKLETTQASTSSARFVMPVNGAIVREYSKGRNDGVDIAAGPGTAVKAADSGTLAAVTQNTNGAKIAVVKHSDGLLTVYVNLTDVTLSRGASVRKGQTIGKIASGFNALHFEVRKGLESVDPSTYLP